MDLAFIKDFFSSYGLPTVIIGIICSAVCFCLNLLFKNKYPIFIKTQLPFLLGIALQFAYEMIFLSNQFSLSERTVAAGMLSGSVAVIINSLINKLKQGDMVATSATSLLIEGLLTGIVPKSCVSVTATAVENIINDTETARETEQLIVEITQIVKTYSEDGFTDDELQKTAELILQAVSIL